MGLYARVDNYLTVCPLQSRLQHIDHGHWATLCQSRLYPPVRDFGFGLCRLYVCLVLTLLDESLLAGQRTGQNEE